MATGKKTNAVTRMTHYGVVIDVEEMTAAGAVTDDEFEAYSILMADSDNTPVPLELAAETVVGRNTTGGVVALTMAQLGAILATSCGMGTHNANGVPLDSGDEMIIGSVRLAAGETITVCAMGVTESGGTSKPDIKLIAKKGGVAFVTTNNEGFEKLSASNTAAGAGLITFHLANDSGTDGLFLSGFANFTVE